MTYMAAIKKLGWERLGMAPFIWLGRLAGQLFPLKTKHSVFLFFPNADIGGSPRVNAELTHFLKKKNPIIIFSKKPHNNQYRERFETEGIRIVDLHKYVDNKLYHFVNFFFRGVLAAWINNQPSTVVFGGESIFFYKVIPHIRRNIRVVELNHVHVWLPYSIGFIDRIDARIFSTRQLKEEAEQQYRLNHLADHYFKKLFFIDNAIDIPDYLPVSSEIMQVFFIGRGSPQKRVHLVAAIAEKIHERNIPVRFNFVGDVSKIIKTTDFPYCSFYGNVKAEAEMQKIYEKADVLLLTSAFEGLPVVIMQMMSYGKVVVSTAVSGIPDYIFHEENGLLIRAIDETEIIAEGVRHIERLQQDAGLRNLLGRHAKEDAIKKFSRESFEAAYARVLGF